MTHPSLIAHLYSNFSQYRSLWDQHWVKTEQFGAFVFLPRNELNWEWWTLPEIRQYIQDGGLDDDEILEPVWDFEFGEESLVLVIEYVDDRENQEAHFHRMNKVRLN